MASRFPRSHGVRSSDWLGYGGYGDIRIGIRGHEFEAYTDANSYSDANAHIYSHTDAHSEANADTDAKANSKAQPEADADTQAHSEADSETEADTHSQSAGHTHVHAYFDAQKTSPPLSAVDAVLTGYAGTDRGAGSGSTWAARSQSVPGH